MANNKIYKLIIIFMCVMISSCVVASDWKQIQDNLWVDTESADFVNKFGTFRFWSKWDNEYYGKSDIVLPNIHTAEYCDSLPTDGDKEACLSEREDIITKMKTTKTIMTLTELNCKKRQFKILDMVMLTDKNKVIDRKTSIVPKAFWSNVIPDTVSGYQYNEFCGEE